MSRKIVLDVETTGIYTKDGHRILEVAALETLNDVLTGRELHVVVNPERDIPASAAKVNGFTAEKVADKPVFAAIAKELKEFIGDSEIIITCRTEADGYTLDIAFMNMEMEKAGFAPFKDEQWLNVRRWSEAMFGKENAKLNTVLNHYKIDAEAMGRAENSGHGAVLDARLLAEVYPKLLSDYMKFKHGQPAPQSDTQQKPPSI